MPAPDQPQNHLSTPPRQQTSDPNALIFEHGQSSNLNTASFNKTDAGPFTNVEDETLGGSFHMSSARSTQAPPAETKFKDYKKLFKYVVGKLVKKVKSLEVKLRTKKRKLVVSDSDQDEGGKQDVDLDPLRTLANVAVTVDSNISPGTASSNPAASTSIPAAVPTGALTVPTGASSVPTDSLSVPVDVPPSVAPASMEEDILGEEAAKRLHDEEQAQVDRQRVELQSRRQQEVLDSVVFLQAILGIDTRIKRQYKVLMFSSKLFANMRLNFEGHPMPFLPAMLLQAQVASFDKTDAGPFTNVEDETLGGSFHMSSPRSTQAPPAETEFKDYKKLFKYVVGKLVKKVKSLEVKLRTKKRKLVVSDFDQDEGGKQDVDLDALRALANVASMAHVKYFTDAQLKEEFEKIQKAISNTHIQAFSQTLKRRGPVLEEPSSRRKKSTEAPIPSVPEVPQSPVVSSHTSSGDIHALYRMDQSTKHLTTLRQIFHMVDRHDLVKLYGLVVQYYNTHPVAGVGLILLYTLSNVHVLESVSGVVLSMFADVSYPLSIKLMEKMLTHKLEIDTDVVGNDMTTAEQLIQFIKN
uniref:Uncharacterized protein n=1 Tax=Tanacetum cinerariifolium TaxID=118510 RepID=A0A6L2MJN6_TANCI|nr:hypothetical protein [Tanacetum cinerariifolium]